MPLPCVLLAWELSKKSTRKPKGYEMKYLCLIYQDESVALKLPRAEAEKIHGDYLAFTDEIKKSGFLLGNQGLQPTPTAPLRRPRSNSAATFSSRPETSTRRFKLAQRSRQPALEVSRSDQSGSERGIRITPMDTFLPPIETPQGLTMKLAYYFTRRQFGKVLTPLKVHTARLPPAFGLFYSKIGKLDKKLTLPPETVLLIREQVARINICLFCTDIARSVAIKTTMNEAKFDAPSNTARTPSSPMQSAQRWIM